MRSYYKENVDLNIMGERLREWKQYEINEAKKTGKRFTNADIAEILGAFSDSKDAIEADEHTISLFLHGRRFLKEEKMKIIAERWNASLDYMYGLVSWKNDSMMTQYYANEKGNIFEKQRAFLASIGIEFHPVICLQIKSEALFSLYDKYKTFFSVVGKRTADFCLSHDIVKRIKEKEEASEIDYSEWERIYNSLQNNEIDSLVKEYGYLVFDANTIKEEGFLFIELYKPITAFYTQLLNYFGKPFSDIRIESENEDMSELHIIRIPNRIPLFKRADNIFETFSYRTVLHGSTVGYLSHQNAQTYMSLITEYCELLSKKLIYADKKVMFSDDTKQGSLLDFCLDSIDEDFNTSFIFE